MTTIEKITNLFATSGKSARSILLELGFSPTALSEWKRGKAQPTTKHITKIADYFHVSVDYLLGRTDEPNFNSEFKLPENLTHYSADEMHTFDVIGTIAAGYNGRAEYDPTGQTVDIPITVLKTRNPADYFILQVRGDSMLPFCRNGDKVLIRRCDSVDSGSIAAIGFDGEAATLKEVKYVQGEDWIELIPFNSKYPIKRVEGSEVQMCRVFGEFVCKIDDTKGHRSPPDENSEVISKFNSLSPDNQKLFMDMLNKMTNN